MFLHQRGLAGLLWVKAHRQMGEGERVAKKEREG